MGHVIGKIHRHFLCKLSSAHCPTYIPHGWYEWFTGPLALKCSMILMRMNLELWIYELNEVNILVQLVSFRKKVRMVDCSLITLHLVWFRLGSWKGSKEEGKKILWGISCWAILKLYDFSWKAALKVPLTTWIDMRPSCPRSTQRCLGTSLSSFLEH